MDKDLKNTNKKTLAYKTNLTIYLKAVELAKLKGKKVGDSIEEELRELMRANPKEVEEIKSKNDLIKFCKDKKIWDMRKKEKDNDK